MQQIQDSYLSTTNISFIEDQLRLYLQDPNSVTQEWKDYFSKLNLSTADEVDYYDIEQSFKDIMSRPQFSSSSDQQLETTNIINAFRLYGHFYADTDPLKIKHQSPEFPTDLDQYFQLNSELVNKYKSIYCGTVGFECSYLDNLKERSWLEEKIESEYLNFNLTHDENLQALEKLVEAEGLEQFLNSKYVGAKRFSLEGCDSFIPMLDFLITISCKNQVADIVLGMAHRGRLNTLVNILGKKPQDLFDEFEGKYKVKNNGDVKYHKGASASYYTSNGEVRIHMLNNPSHLEAVNPVAQGVVRAMQDNLDNKNQILPVLIHGDSAFIGLGVNQGSFNMSQTNAYSVKGTVHIVLNNQIGFTTSKKEDNRSSSYCTDIAKMVQAPVIHVNADDIKSVLFVAKIALEYRQMFEKDIVIDLIGYRKYGHNEADDPSLTQPFMYSVIKRHPGTCTIFKEQLVNLNLISEEDFQTMEKQYLVGLQSGKHIFSNNMKKIEKQKVIKQTSPKYSKKLLQELHDKISNLKLSDQFTLHPTVLKLLQTRQQMMLGEQPVNLSLAETLAYAVLLNAGINIRISGEDVGRGTFTHRMAVLHNYKANNDDEINSAIIPLQRINKDSKFMIYDSILNEEAVLSFEYGYSLQSLNNLVIWEAQFGDFVNGAQVAIDQFITSAESKWDDKSRLVMLLPHGLDGQGPEHSSARIERFLQLSAQDNITLLYPTTAAQMFYMMLEQVFNTEKIRPAIVFLSKRLLRAKEAAVNIDTLIQQKRYQEVIDDESVDKKKIKKIVCCTGQIYYDLLNMKQNDKCDTIAIVRLEQLYPFPTQELKSVLATYTNAKEFLWVQEEHYNQGAWSGIRDNLAECAKFDCISRTPSATTACGTTQMSNEQLKELLGKVFK